MRLARDGTLSNTCPLCPFCGRRIPVLILSSDTWAEFWDHFSTDLFPFEWRLKWNQNKLNFLNIEIFLPTIKNLSIKIKQIIFYSIWNTTHLSISPVRGWTEVVQIPSPNKSIEISNYWKDFLKIFVILALNSHSNGVKKKGQNYTTFLPLKSIFINIKQSKTVFLHLKYHQLIYFSCQGVGPRQWWYHRQTDQRGSTGFRGFPKLGNILQIGKRCYCEESLLL